MTNFIGFVVCFNNVPQVLRPWNSFDPDSPKVLYYPTDAATIFETHGEAASAIATTIKQAASHWGENLPMPWRGNYAIYKVEKS